MDTVAKIMALRLKKRSLMDEARDFPNGPGKLTETQENDISKIKDVNKKLSEEINILLDVYGCEFHDKKIKKLREERKDITENMWRFLYKHPDLTSKQQESFDDAIEKLMSIDREITRVVDMAIKTAH